MDRRDLNELRTIEELANYQTEVRARITEIDTEFRGLPLTDEAREEFDALREQVGEITLRIDELEARARIVSELVENDDESRTEPVGRAFPRPNVVTRRTPDDIFNIAEYRGRARSLDELPGLYRDGAMRAIEIADFPTVERATAQARIEKLLQPSRYRDQGVVALRVLATGAPAYARAWEKTMAGRPLSSIEERALQSYSDADGGHALPFTIDPTFILTSDGSVNPLREIARVESITTKAWQVVSTAGVTAAYVGERTTSGAADGAPSDVDDPTATPVRADVSVDVTAEYLEDYGAAGLLSEIGGMIQVAKDDLEANKFYLGNGSGAPEGIVAAIIAETNSIFQTATNDVYALADIDALIAATPARFRSRGRFNANLAILQLSRSFGTAGQTAGTIYDPLSKTLRGYPSHEATAMDAAATDAKEILLFGDFKAGFAIVDRVGLASRGIDTVDGSGRPTGGRTVYAHWRNTSKVLVFNAFRLLQVK